MGKPNWRSGAPGTPGGRAVGKELTETYYAQSRASEKFRGVNAYADFRELLAKEKDVSAAKVMTPDHLHATIRTPVSTSHASIARDGNYREK